jgi:hypothetical protein
LLGGGRLAAATQTLDAALAVAEKPRDFWYLAVDAQANLLPADSTLPTKGETVNHVADDYGMITHAFGGVTALAAPTMMMLNTNPTALDPYAGMSAHDLFKLLLAGLTFSQWDALTSADGLRLADLSDPAEIAIAKDALFGKLVSISGATLATAPNASGGAPLGAELLDQSTIRLYHATHLGVPIVNESAWQMLPEPTSRGEPTLSIGSRSQPVGPDTEYSVDGVVVRYSTPTVPKDSAIDYRAPAMRKMVVLDGVLTVDDLVARIGTALGDEIYADPRYGKKAVSVVGPSLAMAPAGDILAALAFSVRGTYRKVGDAYVLTNDLLGLGSRMATIMRFAQQAEIVRGPAVAAAGDTLIERIGTINSLRFENSAIAMSDDQRAQAFAAQASQPSAPVGNAQILAPFGDLTAAQQTAARRFVESWNAQAANVNGMSHLTLENDFVLNDAVEVSLVAPPLPGPVDLTTYVDAPSLFEHSPTWIKAHSSQQPAAATGKNGSEAQIDTKIIAALGRYAHSALIATLAATDDVGTLMRSMRMFGFNELWLKLPPIDPSAALSVTDTVRHAVQAGDANHITVIPVIDPIWWSAKAPPDVVDTDIVGESSDQSELFNRTYRRATNGVGQQLQLHEANSGSPASKAVCPLASAVPAAISDLIGKIAAVPGVGGLALVDTDEAGYLPDSGTLDLVHATDPLGYADVDRVAFLRGTHQDPIDFEPDLRINELMRLTIPEFSDVSMPASGERRAAWAAFRAKANADLMATIAAAAKRPDGKSMPLWVRSRLDNTTYDWFGSWSGVTTALPTAPDARGSDKLLGDHDLAVAAHQQSNANIKVVTGLPTTFSESDLLGAITAIDPAWNGIAVDLTAGDKEWATLIGLATKVEQLQAGGTD